MPQPVARMGDMGIGTCPCHVGIPIPIVGTIIIGSPTVMANGLPKARMGDIVMCSCGHVATISLGSPTVMANGLPQARMGDLFTGCPTGTIILGSPTVIVA